MSECCHHSASHAHAHDASDLDTLGPVRVTAAGTFTPMRLMDMDCPTEEALIRKRLEGMNEVQDIEFNLMQRVLTVQHVPDGLDAVLTALRGLGFDPQLPDADGQLQPMGTQAASPRPWWPLALAGLAALAAESVHWFQGPGWLGLLLALVAIGLSGLDVYRKGWMALANRNLNINALMSIAVTGAVIIGEWPEAAMVMVLFAIAETIEARSLDHARRSVERLMDVAPERVLVQDGQGQWQEVLASTVTVGARVRVRPGERVGLDGVIVQGHSEVNQAPITGESVMVARSVDDAIYAGTINGMGELEYRVTAAADNTILARIMHAVHDAQARKAPTQRFVDRFARVYTPLVVGLALLVAVVPPLLLASPWYDAIYRALVLLVIACPCALVISTPVAVVSALGAAARAGILVKGGAYLEQGRQLKWLAFDKTGTLTDGRPVVVDILACGDEDDGSSRLYAASLAARSDHPVSRAMAQALQGESGTPLPPVEVDAFAAIPGDGVQGRIAGRNYYLGNVEWVQAQTAAQASEPSRLAETVVAWRAEGMTVSAFAHEQAVLLLVAVVDTPRKDSARAIRQLHELGLRTLMLTGDNAAVAHYVGKEVGIDRVHAQLLPAQKLQVIEQVMQDGPTGMVGDGINDAPALARADIGFAMGAMGTDTAIETADVALMEDDLSKVAEFIRLSRRTWRILVENISIALGIKAVFLVVTMAGLATMWMAVFADVGASLIVLGNSLRLLRSGSRVS